MQQKGRSSAREDALSVSIEAKRRSAPGPIQFLGAMGAALGPISDSFCPS
jgi:hypothetical protein